MTAARPTPLNGPATVRGSAAHALQRAYPGCAGHRDAGTWGAPFLGKGDNCGREINVRLAFELAEPGRADPPASPLNASSGGT